MNQSQTGNNNQHDSDNNLLLDQIHTIYDKMKSLPSLEPSSHVNEIFENLVNITSKYNKNSSEILSNPSIKQILPDVRSMCSKGESYLEKNWAQRIIDSKHPELEIELFPYYNNYLKLSELEIQAIKTVDDISSKKFLFIGSGALPLSGIVLAKEFKIKIDLLDVDKKACELSKKIIDKLHLSNMVNIIESNVNNFSNLDNYGVILLAALVGLSIDEKNSVIKYLSNTVLPGTVVALRSAENLRKFLYPEVDTYSTFELSPQIVIHPMNDIINSVIITQKNNVDLIDDIVIKDKSSGVHFDFKEFCYKVIYDEYGYKRNPIWHYDLDNVKEIYDKDYSNYFLVYHGEEVIASAAIKKYEKKYDLFKERFDDNTASVWRFFVKKKCQFKGIEEILHKKIEDFAKSHNYTKIYAHEQKSVSGAVRRYLSQGYRIIHEDTDFLGTIHLKKLLDNS
jgi:nicotianamine synthase